MSSSTSNAEDRRIARTKAALRDALIALMNERGLDGFTINDLCAKADLNRGTFYNHYKDKDDLLCSLEDEVLEGLSCLQPHLKSLSVISVGRYALTRRPLPVLVELFDYLRGQAEFLQAVMGEGGDPSFGGRLRTYVCDNFILALLHARYRADRTAFVDYYVAFYANAYLGVICRWIETGMEESSEEMARIAVRLLFIKPGESIKL